MCAQQPYNRIIFAFAVWIWHINTSRFVRDASDAIKYYVRIGQSKRVSIIFATFRSFVCFGLMFSASAKRDSKSNHSESSAQPATTLSIIIAFGIGQIKIGLVLWNRCSRIWPSLLIFFFACCHFASQNNNTHRKNMTHVNWFVLQKNRIEMENRRSNGIGQQQQRKRKKNYYRNHNFYCTLIHQWLWVAIYFTGPSFKGVPMLSIQLYTYLSSRFCITRVERVSFATAHMHTWRPCCEIFPCKSALAWTIPSIYMY